MGALLWIVDVRATRAGRERSLSAMTWRDTLLIGCAQAFAIIPGVSRSGATITAGRHLAFTRADSAKFSCMRAVRRSAGAAGRPVRPAAWAPGMLWVVLAADVLFASSLCDRPLRRARVELVAFGVATVADDRILELGPP